MKKLIFFLILAIAVGYAVFKDDSPPEEKMARKLTKSLIKEHSEGVSFDDHYVQEKGWNEYNVDQYIEVQGNGRQKKRKKVSVRWLYNGEEDVKDERNWVWTSIEVFDTWEGKTKKYYNHKEVDKFYDEW
ncbi:MAG: hypothetical protein LUC88_04710, partial [Prevotella sp.]|nr:hypothetical protein [Prevotella sp.]